MSKDVTVTFSQKHNYGGHIFEPGDKLILPADMAKVLDAAGVLEKPKKAKK